MYGAVFGDIIGSTYEIHNVKTQDFPLFPAGSTYTDDTVLTIAVAEKLLPVTHHSGQKLCALVQTILQALSQCRVWADV